MSKKDLVNKIANQTGTSQKAANEFLDAFIQCVQEEVAEGKNLTLIGFGTFYRALRKATKGRNPQTGAAIDIPASKQPKFRAGKAFKKAVNV
jgi:DNA-binding protein HU-beta